MARGKYSNEQLEFVRVLIEERCTTEMIIQLTKIPHGTISGLSRRLAINMPNKLMQLGGPRGKVLRARKLRHIREKYADQISKLFTDEKSP